MWLCDSSILEVKLSFQSSFYRYDAFLKRCIDTNEEDINGKGWQGFRLKLDTSKLRDMTSVTHKVKR